jgi:hypothetical protein
MDRDMLWRWDQVLKTHPNGMRFSVFGEDGDLLATNEYFSVGGGFVVNDKTKVDENLFYMGVDKKAVHAARLHQIHAPPELEATPATATSDAPAPSTEHVLPESEQEPGSQTIPYPFSSGNSLLELTKRHNVRLPTSAARKSSLPADDHRPDRVGQRKVFWLFGRGGARKDNAHLGRHGRLHPHRRVLD